VKIAFVQKVLPCVFNDMHQNGLTFHPYGRGHEMAVVPEGNVTHALLGDLQVSNRASDDDPTGDVLWQNQTKATVREGCL